MNIRREETMLLQRAIRITLFSICVLASSLLSAQATIALVNVKKVYIEPMENHLDQYLSSEISRQFRGSLEIVTDASGADAILKGVNLGAQNTTKATVNLVDPSGKVVLWSGTAGDREGKFVDLKHGGLQTVAAHLIKNLKKSMQPK
jgi:chemotaxis protein CheY-P-specific phosphatase CheC